MSKMVDARGARTGAAVSVVLLAFAYFMHISGAEEVAAAVLGGIAIVMSISAITALRVNLLSTPFQVLRSRGVIGSPVSDALQPAAGLRLAQAMGAMFLAVALVLGGIGATVPSLSLVAVLAAMQTLLAVTGICVACRFYGIIVWLERRRESDTTPIPRQKIKISR